MAIVKDPKACTVLGVMYMSFFFGIGENVVGFGLVIKTNG